MKLARRKKAIIIMLKGRAYQRQAAMLKIASYATPSARVSAGWIWFMIIRTVTHTVTHMIIRMIMGIRTTMIMAIIIIPIPMQNTR